MSTDQAHSDSYWSVARYLPRRESFAAERLKEAAFEVFLPLIPAGRSATTPMFINYLFVNLNISSPTRVFCDFKPRGWAPRRLSIRA
jgi:hypothetical protein